MALPSDPDLALPGSPSPAELREAHSKRYGSAVVSVVPLASGRLAVLGIARCLVGFAPDLANAIALSHDYWTGELAREDSRRFLALAPSKTSKSLDDLGL